MKRTGIEGRKQNEGSEGPYSREKGQVPRPGYSTGQMKEHFPPRRPSGYTGWERTLFPICSISLCYAVFLVNNRYTLWQKIAKTISLPASNLHWLYMRTQEGCVSSVEQWRCHQAERFCLGVHVSWIAQSCLWNTWKNIYNFFWFARRILPDKKKPCKSSLCKEGAEKPWKKQKSLCWDEGRW